MEAPVTVMTWKALSWKKSHAGIQLAIEPAMRAPRRKEGHLKRGVKGGIGAREYLMRMVGAVSNGFLGCIKMVRDDMVVFKVVGCASA